MANAAELLFLASSFIIFYTYAGYPGIVFLLVKIKGLTTKRKVFPTVGLLPVTLIVAAFNEEKIIEKKIENCFTLDYPPHLLSFIFVTDGSTDATADIVRKYPRITVLHQPMRMGKLAAVNRALLQVNTPVVVFSDANTFMNPEAVRHIMRHYSDPLVGGVAGEKRIMASADSVGKGEGAYWRYESYLKKMDASLKTTVGAAGELFSIRTSLVTLLPPDTIIEDFVQSMLVCAKGYIVKYEPSAYAEETASLSVSDEMERKIRISAGAFQAMIMIRALFNVFRYPEVFFLLVSHRILRWTLCPLSLVTLFISTLILYWRLGSVLYAMALLIQVILYTAAACGWWLALKNKRVRVLYLPFYFVFMNFCVFAGLLKFIRRQQTVLWHSAARQNI